MSDLVPPLHPSLPRLLEVHEVAYQLKSSHEFVRRLIRDHKLVAVQLGSRAWRVRPADLEAFIEGRRRLNGNEHSGAPSPDNGSEA
jgi:excisionase family DNA binding protein